MRKKWSFEDVAGKVENEGLGYMVMDYLSEDQIEDETLSKHWKQAREALEKIGEILEPYSS